MSPDLEYTIEELKVADIVCDEDIQPRVQVSKDAIEDYAAEYRRLHETNADDKNLGLIDVFRDPVEAIDRMANGFTRHQAAIQAGVEFIKCKVFVGDRDACLAHAGKANLLQNAQRYTFADRRKWAEKAIESPVLSKWTDRRLAEQCGLTHPTIGKIRRNVEERKSLPLGEVSASEGSPEPSPAPTIREGKNGKQYSVPPRSTPSATATPTQGVAVSEPAVESAAKPKVGPSDFDARVEPDGEWLAGFRVRGDLSDRCKVIFDQDALTWRRVTAHERFKGFVDLLKHHTPPTGAGAASWAMQRALQIKGPDHWLTCSDCHGQGMKVTATSCKPCRGNGYKIQYA